MPPRLSLATIALLTTPPLLWAANIVVGRMIAPLVPPITLNFLRWVLAFILLLPLAASVLRLDSPLWRHWRRFSWLGLLSIGAYNALQYLALHTSTPINVSLVLASTPIWMLLVGRLFFAEPISQRQLLGSALSMVGVGTVLARGDWDVLLHVRLVPGDVYMLLASLSWALYSWLLAHPKDEPPAIRADWAAFLIAQIAFGLLWAGLFAGSEWVLTPARIVWGWPLAAGLLFIALGPALLAYRCWGAGVRRAGPNIAGFFVNLTPLFAAVLSSALLGEPPRPYHALAFVLIVGGIVVSSVQRGSRRA